MQSASEIVLQSLAARAIEAALSGARIARGKQLAGLLPRQKSQDHEDLVTEGDEAAQEAILASLPWTNGDEAIGVLAEEKSKPRPGGNEARWRWVIDPIDGTLPYSKGEHFWCVSIALQEKARRWESRIGVIYQASAADTAHTLYGRIFFAIKGFGAFVDDPTAGKHPLVKPHTIAPYAELSAVGTFGEWARQEFAARGIDAQFRRSICHASCEMLLGQKSIIAQDSGPLEWDVAAITLIAREAGAYVHCVRTDSLPECDRYEVIMAWDEKLFNATRNHLINKSC